MALLTFAALLSMPLLATGSMQPPRRVLRRVAPSISLDQFSDSALRVAKPRSYSVTKLREMTHVGMPFTQGLEFTPSGQLVETSGDYPPGVGSFVRILDPQTGYESRRITDGLRDSTSSPPSSLFIEGISRMGNRWFASTYLDKSVLEYDADFHLVTTHRFPWEGWGLSWSPGGGAFLATNGSEYLMALDPGTYEAVDVKVATCLGRRVEGLNELELVDDFLGRGPALLGNVINTRLVLALDPATARCTGVFNLDGQQLEPVEDNEVSGYHVANGIAYNKQSRTLIVTGKNWDKMFEIRVEESELMRGDALLALERHLSGALPA